MIIRDSLGIIVQHDPNNPGYQDGGDSACRTAIMAVSGSLQDAALMHHFFAADGRVIRHPTQPKWSDPNETSRDQLMPVLAARKIGIWCYKSELTFAAYAKRGFFCNKDILLPHIIWFMAGATYSAWRFPLAIVGVPCFALALLLNRWLSNEQNQIASMALAAGPGWTWLYKKLRPTWRAEIMGYWSGWRDQREIGERFCAALDAR